MYKLILTFTLLCLTSNIYSQNVDEIINKNNKARNTDIYKDIKSIEAKSTITANNQTGTSKFYYIKPDKFRIESAALENKTTFVINDKKGYATNGKDVRHMPADKMDEIKKSILEQANPFEPAFYNYKEKGDKVEFAGKETLEEGDCDILKYTDKDGKVFMIYILDNGIDVKIKYEEKGKDMEILLKDNKKSGGMLIPHLIVYTADGEEIMKKKFDYIIYNGKIKEDLFTIIDATIK